MNKIGILIIGRRVLLMGAMLMACSFAPAALNAQSAPPPGMPILVVNRPAADDAEAKKPMTPEEVQALALKWVAVAGTVAGALAGLGAAVWMKVQDVKAQVQQHAAQIHALAMNAPPAPGGSPSSAK